MPSLRSLVVRRAPQIEMGAATSSVTSITPLKNIPDNKKSIDKVDKFNGIRSPLLRNNQDQSSMSLNPAVDRSFISKTTTATNTTTTTTNGKLLRPESCASLEAQGAASWNSLGHGVLRKCETAVGLSTLALEGRPVNRSRVCSRCSSLLSLASSSRYSLAAGGHFVPASSQSIAGGRIKCVLCITDVHVSNTTQIESCGCSYCKDCMQGYAEYEINEGAYEISCPSAQCEQGGILSAQEIKDLVTPELMEKYQRFRLNRDVSVDKGRAWCPSPGCETVCSIASEEGGSVPHGPVHCPSCSTEFCSLCREPWHNGACPEVPSGIPIDNERIKCCPMCSVPIEKDEGCAQMMCKRCKHVFCWYCLASLDDDFLLRHYDKGPCKNKLGHSRASVIWHRTQVIGIFAGFGLLLLVASPLLLLAAPCIVCCKCRVCGSSRLEQDEGGSPEDAPA